LIIKVTIAATAALLTGLAASPEASQQPLPVAAHTAMIAASPVKCSPLKGRKLVFHGGRIWDNGPISAPTLNFVYWGSWWRTHGRSVGFELTSLYKDLGQSSWALTLRQYCDLYGPMQLPASLLAGATFKVDPRNPPPKPSEKDIGTEVAKYDPIRMANGGFNYGIEVIVTPPGSIPAYDKTQGACGHHSWTKITKDHEVLYLPWIDIPYGMISLHGCGLRHGVSGALSVVAGHEWAEAVTDPFANGVGIFGTAWATGGRGSKSEVADLCYPLVARHLKPSRFVVLKLKSGSFVMQQLWSNATGKCVASS
jgi:hypothetical protein